MSKGREWRKKALGMIACVFAVAVSAGSGMRMETLGQDMISDAEYVMVEEETAYFPEDDIAETIEPAEADAWPGEENAPGEVIELQEEGADDEMTGLPENKIGEDDVIDMSEDEDGYSEEISDGLIEEVFEEELTEEAETLEAGSGSQQYETAPEIMLGGTYDVDLTYGAGCKYFKFVPTATAYYRFRSISTFTFENQIDPVAFIFSADGTMLAWHDDIDAGSSNRNFGLVVLLQKGETYYLKTAVSLYPAAYSFTVEKGDVADLSEKATDFEMWADGLQGMDVCPGGKVVLVVGWSRSDDRIPTFSWEKVGEGILPETSNVLTVKAPDTAGTYQSYDCYVTCDGVKAHNYDGAGLIRFTVRAEEDAHDPSDWTVTVPATVFDEGTEVRTCRFCGKLMEHRKIAKPEPFITMNVAENSTLPLQVKQSTKAVKVTDLQEGDYVVSWKSSKPKVASVSKTGKIKGKKKGKTTITVTTAAGAVYKFKVKVQTGRVKTKQITAETENKITIKKKEKIKLGAAVLPLTSLDKLTYSTSSSKIATVKKGTVTGKAPGKATITVKAGTKTLKIRVKVIR